MVLSFAERKTTPEVIQLHLKLTPKEFDAKLDAFMRARFGKVADNLKEIRAAMLAATKALAKKDWETAIAEGLKATSGYPATAILSSGYEVLAKAYTAKGYIASRTPNARRCGSKCPRPFRNRIV